MDYTHILSISLCTCRMIVKAFRLLITRFCINIFVRFKLWSYHTVQFKKKTKVRSYNGEILLVQVYIASFIKQGILLHSLLMHSLSSNHLYRCPTSYNIAGCVFSYRRKLFFSAIHENFLLQKSVKINPKHRHTAPTSVRFSTGYGHPKLLIEC